VFIRHRRFKLQHIECSGKHDRPKERNLYYHGSAFTHGNPNIEIDLADRISQNTRHPTHILTLSYRPPPRIRMPCWSCANNPEDMNAVKHINAYTIRFIFPP
jgi:acetyl esterase/lipase